MKITVKTKTKTKQLLIVVKLLSANILQLTESQTNLHRCHVISVLQRIMGGDAPPGKVQEIKSDITQHLPVALRDDSMLLYGPDLKGTKAAYEIVLHKPFSESMNTSYR